MITIIFLLILFVIYFVLMRSFLSGIKYYQLNNNAYKKRKKTENIVEWFFLTKWRDVIPRFFLFFYFAVIILHIIAIIVVCVFAFLGFEKRILNIPLFCTLVFDMLWWTVLKILFWQKEHGFCYKRWIKKQKRNNK